MDITYKKLTEKELEIFIEIMRRYILEDEY